MGLHSAPPPCLPKPRGAPAAYAPAQVSEAGRGGKDGHFPEQAQCEGLWSTKGRKGAPEGRAKALRSGRTTNPRPLLPAVGPGSGSLSGQGTRQKRCPCACEDTESSCRCWHQQSPPPPAPLLSQDCPREGSRAQPTAATSLCVHFSQGMEERASQAGPLPLGGRTQGHLCLQTQHLEQL